MKKTILILGADGLLGSEFESSDFELIKWNKQDLDITDKISSEKKIVELSPNTIINCTGYTNVDRAEEEKKEAFAINAEALKTLSEVSNKINALLVHYSTDYVFDGNNNEGYYESDKPAKEPLNVYGESKLKGEQYIQEIANKYYILRTSWLFGEHGRDFIDTVIRLADTKDKITIVNDEYGKPSSAHDVASATLEIIKSEGELNKIYHIVNEGKKVSWYEYAQFILENTNKDALKKLIPITSKEYGAPATRPKYSFLHNTSLSPLPSWEESVKDYLSFKEDYLPEVIIRQAIKDIRLHLKNMEKNKNLSEATKIKIVYFNLVLNELDKFCAISLFVQGLDEKSIKNIDRWPWREDPKNNEVKEDYNNTKNALLGSLVDELAVSQRKLAEIIVDLIGFQNVDNDDYYLHYFTVMGLFQLDNRIQDSEEYYQVDKNFGFHNKIRTFYNNSVPMLALDYNKIWYAKIDKNEYKTFGFSKKFREVRDLMSEDQKIFFKSPRNTMGHSNLHLHYISHIECAYLDLEKIKEELIKALYPTCFYIINIVCEILEIEDDDNDFVKLCNEFLKILISRYGQEGKKVNDFVLIEDSILENGVLAQIIEVKSISKGIRKYKVRLFGSNEEYWIAGNYTSIFWKYDDVKLNVEKILEGKSINNVSSKKLNEMIEELVVRCRELGYRGMNVTPPPDSIDYKDIRGVFRLNKKAIEDLYKE